MYDRNNQLTNIDPATGDILTAKDSGSVYDRTLIHPDRNDFAPRVGVVWSMTPTLVMRGGYGIFYQQTDRYGSESQLGLNLPQLVDAAISSNSAGRRRRRSPSPRASRRSTPTTVNRPWCSGASRIPNQDTPIVQQFSIGPEWQFAEQHGRGRGVRRQPHPQRAPAPQPQPGHHRAGADGPRVVYPYAQYGYGNAFLEQIVTNGNADYDALQARLQRRFSGPRLHGGLHLEHDQGRLPRSPERRRRRHRQHTRRTPTTWRPITARCRSTCRTGWSPASSPRCRSAKAARMRPVRRARRDRQRLVGQRHPHAQLRRAVHHHLRRSCQHRAGPLPARRLHGRRRARAASTRR